MKSYLHKFNVFIFIVQFLGNYFFGEYFPDVLRMIYNYPNLKINIDSALMGPSEQSVQLIWSWMETQSFANEKLEANLRYKNKETVLASTEEAGNSIDRYIGINQTKENLFNND